MKKKKLYDLLPYTDRYGMLVQTDKDPGDSIMETCMWKICEFWSKTTTIRHFHLMYNVVRRHCFEDDFPKYRIRRHSDPKHWTRQWVHGTADQWQNFIIYAGLMRDYKTLIKILIGFIFRLGFCNNTMNRNVYLDYDEHVQKSPSYRKWEVGFKVPDFRPGIWILIIRCLPIVGRVCWPIFLVSDLGLVFSAWHKTKPRNKKILKGNDGNYFCRLLAARYFVCTPTAKLAIWIYKNYRYRIEVGQDVNRIQAALYKQYGEGLNKKNPPLHLVADQLARTL